MFDGFAHKCDDLNHHHLPAIARLPVNHDNAFLVEVSYRLTLIYNNIFDTIQ